MPCVPYFPCEQRLRQPLTTSVYMAGFVILQSRVRKNIGRDVYKMMHLLGSLWRGDERTILVEYHNASPAFWCLILGQSHLTHGVLNLAIDPCVALQLHILSPFQTWVHKFL
jgi:hypothetical protein